MGKDAQDTLVSLGDLAWVLGERGALAEAESVLREVVARNQRLGFETFMPLNNLALAIFLQGRSKEAETLLVQALPLARSKFEHGSHSLHPTTLHLQRVLARVLTEQGRLDEAEALARETLAGCRAATPGQEGMGRVLLLLGRILVEKSQLEAAKSSLSEALAIFRANYSQKRELAAQAENWLGAVALFQRDFRTAEALLVSSSEEIISTPEVSPAERLVLLGHLPKLYREWDKIDLAETWEKKIEALQGSTLAKKP